MQCICLFDLKMSGLNNIFHAAQRLATNKMAGIVVLLTTSCGFSYTIPNQFRDPEEEEKQILPEIPELRNLKEERTKMINVMPDKPTYVDWRRQSAVTTVTYQGYNCSMFLNLNC